MTWVRRVPVLDSHACHLPTEPVTRDISLGVALGQAFGRALRVPAGRPGDLWRCPDCAALWQITGPCTDEPTRRGGACLERLRWRPAPWWTRLRYRNTAVPDAPTPAVPST